VSPTGDLIARPGPDGTIVSRPDGSDQRVIKGSYYASGGWSPDGRKLLFMQDVGGGFTMSAVSVDAPFTAPTVVPYTRVNNARSWPGYGDVSWQPAPGEARTLASSTGCSHAEVMDRVFPKARAIGFTGRTTVGRSAATYVPRGSCGTWSISYRRGPAGVDVNLTLFRSHKQALWITHELRGWEHLKDGALVKEEDEFGAPPGGPMKRELRVWSVYRDVLIFSRSAGDRLISLASQLRLHRRVHAGVHLLEEHPARDPSCVVMC
jgi:hypothetical protein